MPDGYKWAYNNVKQGRGDLCYVWADPVPFGATCGAPPERPVDKCENKGAEVTIRRYISPSVAAAGLKTEFKCCNGKASNVGETSSEGDLPFGIKFQRGRDVISVVRMGTYTEPQIRQLAKDIDTKIR